MSDTPETDRVTMTSPGRSEHWGWVEADHAKRLERERDELRAMLKQAMQYLESTDGRRGDLVGCAVKSSAYEDWLKKAGRETLAEGQE